MTKAKKVFKWVGIVFLVLLIAIAIFFIIGMGIFHPGNNKQYSVDQTPSLTDCPLAGKTIIFLGSSVTNGAGAYFEAFPEFMEKRDGIIAVKEAVNGTTLTDKGGSSYVKRVQKIDTAIQADFFICQLSTNDAAINYPLGNVSDSFDRNDFDTQTIAGGIEFIISYAAETWGCPVVFYSNPKYDNENYAAMVDILLQIQDKWGIGVMDFWNDEAISAVTKEERDLYMVDDIHPTRCGYGQWLVPVFEDYLASLL